jgi:N6-L-threonylcarbamoyladenine synthase
LIDKYAQLGKAFAFTKPKVPGLNFIRFKTHSLFYSKEKIENPNFVDENLNDICASIQHTIIEILMDKLKLAVQETGITQIAIGGGVGKFWNSKTLKETEKNTVGKPLFRNLNIRPIMPL